MKPKGLGTDIVEVARIGDILTRHPETFAQKFFLESERVYCDSFRVPAERYAGRFSAKEAVAKALGTGFGQYLAFHDLEILNDDFGKPYVLLSENAKQHFGNVEILLSISHCKDYATAVAIVY